MLTVLADSTCDLSPEQLRLYGIQTMPIHILHQGQEFENAQLTPRQMADRVRASGQPAVTRAPTPEECAQVYRQMLTRSDGVLHLTTSSDLTGTHAAAVQAAGEFAGRVQVFDSRYASYGLGAQAMRAAAWADHGLALDDIVRRLTVLRGQMLFVFAVEQLDFLRINGRIGSAAAFVGNLLGLNPLIEIRGGAMDSVGRARGQSGALKELSKAALHFHRQQGGAVELVCFSTAGGEAGAAALHGQLDYLHAKDGGVHSLGAGITANAGPAFGLLMLPAD